MDRWRVRVLPVEQRGTRDTEPRTTFYYMDPALVRLDVEGFFTTEQALRHVIARLGTVLDGGDHFLVMLDRLPHDPLKGG